MREVTEQMQIFVFVKRRRNVIRYNYHTHTDFSDGKNTAEEMVLAAIEKGFHSIGISDHSYVFNGDDWCMLPHRMEEYLSTIKELKEKYAAQIKVYAGLEQDALSDPVPHGLDYYIGSVHLLKKGDHYLELDNTRELLWDGLQTCYGGDCDALAEDYFALVASYAKDDNVAFIGHFDLITKFDEKYPPIFLPTPRYTAAWKQAAEELLRAGKIFEINTGALFRGLKTQPYPCKEILKFLGEHKAKVIVSSDSHSVDSIDGCFDRAEELIQTYGLQSVDLF